MQAFVIHSSPDTETPVAVVTSPSTVPLAFVDLPNAGQARRARVDLTDNELVRLSGFVDLAGRRFQLGARVDLEPRHVFANVGTIVTVAGRRAGGVDVVIPTPFREPDHVTTTVPCRSVAYEARPLGMASRPRELALLSPVGRTLTFFDAPEGRPVFHAGVETGKPILSLLERRGDFLQVLVGEAPETSFRASTLIVNAWVRREEVAVAQPRSDRDSHGSILDQTDRCPGLELPADTPLHLGFASRSPIGTALRGAAIEVLERRGARAAISFLDGRIKAPPGQRFVVEMVAGPPPCANAEPEPDGCPCMGPDAEGDTPPPAR